MREENPIHPWTALRNTLKWALVESNDFLGHTIFLFLLRIWLSELMNYLSN